MDETYIKLYRKISKWQWYTDIPVKVLFIHLVISASYSDHLWRDIEIKRGQYLSTISDLARETGLTEKQVRGALTKLEKSREISRKSLKNRFTIIKILNYDNYQNGANRGQAENSVDMPFFGVDDCEQGKPRANRGQTEGEPRAMTKERKERKEGKKGKNNVYAHFETFWSAYPRKVARQKAMQAFEELNVDDELLGIMLNAIKVQNRAWDDPQYIPYPENWLRNHRWEDEVQEPERTYDIEAFDNMTFLNELSVS